MRVYLAGKMSGVPQFNYPAFYVAAKRLRADGYEVVSPAEMDDPAIRRASLASDDGNLETTDTHGLSWGDFLARDVKLIADGGIDAIAVLPGWEDSRGARLETFVGSLCGIFICSADTMITVSLRQLAAAWTGIDVLDLLREEVAAG